ncbi:hypothetical protein CI238_10743 [Colletotrichum incanum]|uniref:Uncharacterized protein n=1 Tax=Colletotrichum incanum TaxID=1573173 RepID=A0A161WEG6_COLIC|nr:hypothetical protein CI238_10743 [Colletotrichum incanum]
MRVKRDAEYDELDERPKRKYQKDISGLRVPVVQDQTEISGPEEPSGESVFRLAWLFIEGWRHKLRKAGDMIERSRWEWELDGTATVLTFGVMIADARQRVPEELNKKKKQRKSVHWA